MREDTELAKAKRYLDKIYSASVEFEEWAFYYLGDKPDYAPETPAEEAAYARVAALVVDSIGVGALYTLRKTAKLILSALEAKEAQMLARSPIKSQGDGITQDGLYYVVTHALGCFRAVREAHEGFEAFIGVYGVDPRFIPVIKALPETDGHLEQWADLIAEIIVAGANFDDGPPEQKKELSDRIEANARSYSEKKQRKRIGDFHKAFGVPPREFMNFSDKQKLDLWEEKRGDKPITWVEKLTNRARKALESPSTTRKECQVAWKTAVVEKLEKVIKLNSGL